MAFNGTNPFVVGEDLRKSGLDRLMDNTIALKEARIAHDLGGSYHDAMETTGLTDIPGAVWAEINGTNLGGLTVEVHAMCQVATGTGTIYLYNRTDVANVGSAATFTNTSPALVKITGLTLATALKVYNLRGGGDTTSALVRVWGAKLILR
jgi:hypothetical protein